MSEDKRRRTPQEVIAAAMEFNRLSLYKMLPAEVVKIYAFGNDGWGSRVDCRILVKRVFQDEAGERQTESWPIIPSVPVAWFGVGNYRMIGQLSDGKTQNSDVETPPATTGMLIWSQFSLDKWLTGDGSEVDPELDHSHALTDAVFMPGLRPFGRSFGIGDGPLEIGHDEGAGMIRLWKDLVIIGSPYDEAQFVALADLVGNELQSIKTALADHTHQYDKPTSGSTAPTATSGSDSSYDPGSVAAEYLKAK